MLQFNGDMPAYGGDWLDTDENTVPSDTIRFKFGQANYTPPSITGVEWIRMMQSPNVWDAHITSYVDSGYNIFRNKFTNVSGNPVQIVCGSLGTAQAPSRPTGLFDGCTGLTQVGPLSITTEDNYPCNALFRGCTNLTSADISATHVGTYNLGFYQAFQNCTSLSSINLSVTGKIGDAQYMFMNCTSLSSITPSANCKIGNAQYMFYNCESLTTAPALDLSEATNLTGMYQECSSLTAVPMYTLREFANLAFMFQYCYNVESGAYDFYDYARTRYPTSVTRCFRDCGSNTTTGAAELARIPSDWK